MYMYDAIEDQNEDTLYEHLVLLEQRIARIEEEGLYRYDDGVVSEYCEDKEQRDRILARLSEIT